MLKTTAVIAIMIAQILAILATSFLERKKEREYRDDFWKTRAAFVQQERCETNRNKADYSNVFD